MGKSTSPVSEPGEKKRRSRSSSPRAKKQPSKTSEDALAARLRNEVAKLSKAYFKVDDDDEEEATIRLDKAPRRRKKSKKRAAVKDKKQPKKVKHRRHNKSTNATAAIDVVDKEEKNVEEKDNYYREVAWHLKKRLDQTENETVQLRNDLKSKALEIRRKERELSMMRNITGDEKLSNSGKRRLRHEEVLEESKAYGSKSRKERMALRSRARTLEEREATLEYERQRREQALIKEEEKYLKQKARKEKLIATRKRQKEERLRQLEMEYQEVWNDSLKNAHPSAIRSRPAVQRMHEESIARVAISPTNRGSLHKDGHLSVQIVDTYLQNVQGASHLRIVLLPFAEEQILSIDAKDQKGNRSIPPVQFRYAGSTATVPTLRVELHGCSTSGAESSSVILAVASIPVDECISKSVLSEASMVEQISFQQYGIVKFGIEFKSTALKPQAFRMETQRDQTNQSRLAVAREGILRVRVVEATNLKDLNHVLRQDPYVRLTLSPWNTVVTTPVKKSGGTRVRWSPGEATFDMQFPGAPPMGLSPILSIQVMESENLRNDRFIGSFNLDLKPYITQNENQTNRLNVNVFDMNGASTGCVTLDVAFAEMKASRLQRGTSCAVPEPLFTGAQYSPINPVGSGGHIASQIPNVADNQRLFANMQQEGARNPPSKSQQQEFSQQGKLYIRAVYGQNLRSVQRIGNQDPFVVATLRNGGDSGKCKSHNGGGINPEWDDDAGLIVLNYGGTKSPEDWPLVDLQVFDAELVMKDRLIGSTTLCLGTLSRHHQRYELDLEAKDTHAGVLVVEVWFQPAELLSIAGGTSPVGNKKQQRGASHMPGSITIQVTSCTQLRSVQLTSKQDPFVQVTLLPWKTMSKTKTHVHGGRNPSWSVSDGTLILDYPGAPPSGEQSVLHFQVMDAEMLMSDRFIADATINLEDGFFESLGAFKPMQIGLKDKSGNDAGTLNIYIGFASSNAGKSSSTPTVAPRDGVPTIATQMPRSPAGSCKSSSSPVPATARSVKKGGWHHQLALRAVAIKAQDLRSVQTIGRQDPYVKITHLRSMTSTRTKCLDHGGINPVWDMEKHKSDMRMVLPEVKRDEPEEILIEVFDEESVMQDRFIGGVKVDLWKDVLNNPIHGKEDHSITFRLQDKKGKDAGLLLMQMTLFHYEGNEDQINQIEVRPGKILERICTNMKAGLQKLYSPLSGKSPLSKASNNGSVVGSPQNSSSGPSVDVIGLYVRVIRGKNVDYGDGGITSFVNVTFRSTKGRTKSVPNSMNPVWSESSKERLFFRFPSILDANALDGEFVQFNVVSRKKVINRTIGSFQVSLLRAPYAYDEDVLQSESKATKWYRIVEADGTKQKEDAQIQVAVMLVRKPRTEVAAAVKIQARTRGFQARRQSKELKASFFQQMRNRAAVQVQSAYRGMRARLSTAKIKEIQTDIGNLDAFAASVTKKALARVKKDNKAAVTIQRYTRGSLARKRLNMAKYSRHVIRVQSCVRRFRARRHLQKSLMKIPRGVLVIEVVRAWNLHKVQWLGRQDPYVRFVFEPGHLEHKTKSCTNGGSEPVWIKKNHETEAVFSLPPSVSGTCADIRMEVSVLDKAMFRNDPLIGSTTWSRVSDILFKNKELRRKPMHIELDKENGTLEVLVSWIPEVGMIHLIVKIQTLFRAKLARARVQLRRTQHKQAVQIQRRFRGHRERVAFDTRRKSLQQDTVVTAAPRSTQNSNFDETHAAIMLQKMARSKSAQKVVSAKRQQKRALKKQQKSLEDKRDGIETTSKLLGDQAFKEWAKNNAEANMESSFASQQWNSPVNVSPSRRMDRIIEEPVHQRPRSLGGVKVGKSIHDKVFARLEARNKHLEEQRLVHKEQTKHQRMAEPYPLPIDIVRVRVINARNIPMPKGPSLHKNGYVVQASVYPQSNKVTTKPSSDGWPRNPTWAAQDQNLLEVHVPAERDHREWPVLTLKLMRPSAIHVMHPSKVVGRAEVPLTAPVVDNGVEHLHSISLNDAHGAPVGTLTIGITVFLLNVGAETLMAKTRGIPSTTLAVVDHYQSPRESKVQQLEEEEEEEEKITALEKVLKTPRAQNSPGSSSSSSSDDDDDDDYIESKFSSPSIDSSSSSDTDLGEDSSSDSDSSDSAFSRS